MKKPNIDIAGFTTKRSLIDKANTTAVIAAGIATFLVIFTLISAKTMTGQIAYQNKAINNKKDTLKRLEDNLKARDDLVNSYEAFVSTSQNAIGGSATGESERDGDNAKIILDALPSKYDFPALTSSLEKLTNQNSLAIETITGMDDEVAQSAQTASSTPQPVPIAFQIKVKGPYEQLQRFVVATEKSIRPIKIQKQSILASENGVSLDITAETYYQPEKSLELKKEVLKP